MIAYGCLVAHGDIAAAQTKKLRDEWSADAIIKALESMHPNFYPQAAIQNPKDRYNVIPRESGFLTKSELLRLYGRTGAVVHRGSVSKIMSGKMPIQTNFPDIASWTAKIKLLLGLHLISLFDGNTVLVCGLRNAENFEGAWVAFAEGQGP